LYATPITRPASRTDQVARATIFIFIAQFMNMALIPLIVYSTREINELWYQNVGNSIMYNFVIYAITPNITGFIMPNVYLWKSRLTGYLSAVDQAN